MLFVLLPLLLASGQLVGDFRPDACPRLVCGNLNTDHTVMTPNLPWVCARGQDPTKIIVDACPDGLYCEDPLSFFATWDPRQYFSFVLKCNATLQGSPYQTYPDVVTMNNTMAAVCSDNSNCKSRLAVGSHPKQCLSDSDCLQLDGSSLPCVCGSDGNRYCALNSGDWLLADRQQAACNGFFERFLYWELFRKYYPFLHDSPHCLGQVFSNIGLLDKLAMGVKFETVLTAVQGVGSAGSILAASVALFMA